MATHTLGRLDREEVKVRLVLTLPSNIYDHYEEQATKRDMEVEALLVERLSKCRDHTAQRGFYLNDEQRAALEESLGHMLRTPQEIVDKLRGLLSLKAGKLSIEIPANVQARIRTRVFKGESYETVVEREVLRALEIFVGLR